MTKTGSIISILTPRNSDSVPVNLPRSSLKKSVRPQITGVCLVEFWRCDSLGFVPNGSAVDADLYSQHMERVHEILRRRYPALVNRNRVLLHRAMRDLILHEEPWQKFRNWEESNCYHTQHSALILRPQITICFDPWSISCLEEISKTLKLWKWDSSNSSYQKTRDWFRRGIINSSERRLKIIESDDL